MSSTFTSPIRVFKRNNPSNDGTIAPDNTGAARLSQQQFFAPITATRAAGAIPTFDVGSTTAVPFVLPAGSIIESIDFLETSAPATLTGGVITVALVQTSPVDGSLTTTTLGTFTPDTTGGKFTLTAPATAAAAALYNNIGTLDATLTFTATAITVLTGTLAGTFSVNYTARNADGSITPYGSGYTNS
jgi:hypothetical protein